MNRIFDLTGKVAIVTGGYGHLGSSMALALADSRAQVYVGGRDETKYAKKFLTNKPNNLHFIKMDIGSTESIKKAYKFIFDKHKAIDIIVNNGVFLRGRAKKEGISDEDFLYSMDGIISSVHKCIREVSPYMIKQKSGKIINISSMYGVVSPNFALYEGDDCENYLNPPQYGSAKAAVIQLSRYYAVALGRDNIQVNTISPGPFPKDQIQKDNPAFIKRLAERNPTKRIGDPTDLDGVVKLLSSKASDFITGQNICVDGGWTIW